MDPGWPPGRLAGRWVGIDDEGVATEESWTDPAAGAMFGVSRTIRDGQTVEIVHVDINRANVNFLNVIFTPGDIAGINRGLIGSQSLFMLKR